MASSEFNCKRGWLIAPDKTQNGIMVPFFVKTRSKDMFTTTKTVANFLIEEYEDKIVMRRTFVPSFSCFINSTMYNVNTLWHTIFLPYTIKNDENFNVNISLMVDYDEENIWLSTVLSVKPLYTNESKNEIYALRINASNQVSKPEALLTPDEISKEPVKYFLEISGNKYSELNVTFTGFHKSEYGGTAYELQENSDYYAYSSYHFQNLSYENQKWYSNKKTNLDAISSDYYWPNISTGSNVKIHFYLDNERGIITSKYEYI